MSDLIDFPPAYCITLRQTPERTAAAQLQFEREGIPVKFFYGIHGLAHGIEPMYPMHHNGTEQDPNTPYYQAPGKLAINLNHYFVWEMARLLEHEAVLIFEDDVMLPPSFVDAFWLTMRDLPSDWDMLYLEHCCGDDTPEAPGRRVKRAVPMCLAAYLVRDRALEILLKSQEPMNAPVDILMAVRALPHLNTYITTPKLVRQGSFEGLCPAVPCVDGFYSPEQLQSLCIG